eukprot:symbB.v1.2.027979.t1/scaffold2914.1/size67303/2
MPENIGLLVTQNGTCLDSLLMRKKLIQSNEHERKKVPLRRQRRWTEDRWGRRQSIIEYFGELFLEADRESFNVSFDTGSANVVLPCAPRKGPKLRYDICAADDLGETSDMVTLTYGTGEVNGSYTDDRICVGGVQQHVRTCTSLRFVAARQLSADPFLEAPFDGVLGLALPILAEGSNFSFFDELVKGRLLEQNVFAIYFSKDFEGGELILGGVDEEKMETNLTWVPVSKPGFWQVAVSDLTLDGVAMNICGSQGSYRSCACALDSGTSGALAAPSWLARRLASQLSVQQCGSGGSGPRLGIRLEESPLELSLDPSDYLDDESDDDGSTSCGSLQLMAVDVPAPHGPVMLLGDRFLRKYYTVYDRERLRIGFSLARHGKKGPIRLGSPTKLGGIKQPRA